MTPTRLELTLTGQVNVRFQLISTKKLEEATPTNGIVPSDPREESEGEVTYTPSALAALMLSLSRLALVKRYRIRAGLGTTKTNEDNPDILRQLLTFAQYASVSLFLIKRFVV